MTKQQNTDAQEIEDLKLETLNAIFKGQKDKVKKLYDKVEILFTKGSDYTRSLIANNFIFPLSTLLEMNYSWGREYLNLFPSQLNAEYCRQINSSGI
jgi:hypothetical protein